MNGNPHDQHEKQHETPDRRHEQSEPVEKTGTPDAVEAAHVRRDGDRITVTQGADSGLHIRPRGADFPAGATLSPRRMRPADLALLAAMNVAQVPCARRPVVALIATGFLTQATLLFRLIRRRGLRGVERRLVLTRAVWGGPFGTLGAIWDLTAGSDPRPGP